MDAVPSSSPGTRDALYERHLTFDRVIDPKKAEPRGQFEAVARSLRDVVSQRWLQTDKTYERKNPKRAYYLSMEFLLGRSLTNNMTNLLLTSFAFEAMQERGVDPLALIEMEPDAGLGNGGLGRLAACFIDSMATMQLPGMGYGLRYEYGIFQADDSGMAGKTSSPTTGCGVPIRGRSRGRGNGRGQAELFV